MTQAFRPVAAGLDPAAHRYDPAAWPSSSNWGDYVRVIYDPTVDNENQESEPEICLILGDTAVLERVANPCDAPYMTRFVCPEFTSLCPVTGAPDFAHLVIDYVPRDWIVESKSLKLYLGSFRNHGAFHEACTTGIGQRRRRKWT